MSLNKNPSGAAYEKMRLEKQGKGKEVVQTIVYT